MVWSPDKECPNWSGPSEVSPDEEVLLEPERWEEAGAAPGLWEKEAGGWRLEAARSPGSGEALC